MKKIKNCCYCGKSIIEDESLGIAFIQYSNYEDGFVTICCSLLCLIKSLIVPHGFDKKSVNEIIECIKNASD